MEVEKIERWEKGALVGSLQVRFLLVPATWEGKKR